MSSKPETTAAIHSAGAPRNTALHARSAAESPEGLSRDADEICNESLLRRDSVDGQYVAQLFKWIKQHLRIKRFYGTSENAVKTQIWIAVSVYVLVAIVKKRLNLEAPLYTLLQILSLTLFEKMPILQALLQDHPRTETIDDANQLTLFAS